MMERGKQLRGVARVAAMAAVLGLSSVAIVSMVGTHVTVRAADTGGKKAGPLQLPSGAMAKRIVSQVQPKYPEEAKKARIQGAVVLDATIGTDGTIEHLTVVSGPKELRQSALVAVRQWTYKPFVVDGNAVEVETTIHVIYTLNA